MNLIRSTTLALTLFFTLIPDFDSKGNDPEEGDLIILSVEEVRDKIRGGLLGQILGNLNGLPHEFQYINEPGNIKNYIPSLPAGAWTDDDTDLEWVYIHEMQKSRKTLLSREEIYGLWKERINQRIWCSNRYARYLMDIGIKPPYTGYGIFNPWANFNISGQFLCETFGLIAPGMPQTAAKIGLNYTTVAINNEPAQATQLFTSMISHAFIEKDIYKILNAGMGALDSNSVILQIIKDIKEWHQAFPENWRRTRQLLKEKYTRENGRIRDINGFELNTGSIIAALLYGKGDFQESLKLAFNFGWDADCNAATVGTIIGVTYGYKKMLNPADDKNPSWQIVDRYKNVTRDNMPMDETITTFADRLIEMFEMINRENGGKETLRDNLPVYKIRLENPAPIIQLSTDLMQKKVLKDRMEAQIISDLHTGNREERAKTAYIAICLDLSPTLIDRYPKQWETACWDLSGYWKIMNNIFSIKRDNNDFEALKQLREKFMRAGFNAPLNDFDDKELYNDFRVWKDPNELY